MSMLLRQLDGSKLQRWFERLMPAATDLEIAGLRRAFPGLSRETWFVTVQWREDGSDRRARYVLRTPLPGNRSLAPRTLEYEANVYRTLAASDLPMPPYVAYETDPKWLIDGDRPFLVRGWVDGVLEPRHLNDPDPTYDGLRIAVAKELIARLAQVHALDWHALGLDSFMSLPATPADVAGDVLDEVYADYLGSTAPPQPALLELILSLKESPPEPPSRITLVKENCGLGDEVWDEERPEIIAMCDWETASLGDPAVDMVMAVRSTGWCWNVDAMLDYYESLTGERITRSRFDYYAAMHKIRQFAVLQGRAREYVVNGIDRRVQLMSVAYLPYLTMPSLAKVAGF
ncbi:phosphotransferase family protein [Sphingomonas sp. UYEF23]|uniref:phosphotransferase family protein n=1 Tax=Sphingomonas sp. UYEF23 TaxID=1756408 RepID=UPI003395F44F